MGLFSATPIGAAVPELFNEDTVLRIKVLKNAAGAVIGSVILFNDVRKPVEVSDTLLSIFNQQNVTGKTLEFILVTEVTTPYNPGGQIIVATCRITDIYPEGTGAKIIFKGGQNAVKVTEGLVTILGYQTPQVLDLIPVTRSSDGILILLHCDTIDKVTADGGGSMIRRLIQENIKVNETPAAIFAAQP